MTPSPRLADRRPAVLGVTAAGYCLILIGVSTLAGWTLNIPRLTAWNSPSRNMPPISALAVIGLGLAIQLLRGLDATAVRRRLARVLSLLVGLPAVLLTATGLLGAPEAMRRLLLLDQANGTGTGGYPNASGSIALAAALLLLAAGRKPWRGRLAVAIVGGGVITLTGLVFLLENLYGLPLLYKIGYVPLSLNTSTSLIIVGLAAGVLAAPPPAPSETAPHGPSVTVLATAVTAICVAAVAGAYAYYHQQELQVRSRTALEIDAVSHLKQASVVQWRSERLGDGAVIRENPYAIAVVGQIADNGVSAETLAEFSTWLRTYRDSLQYDQTIVITAAGRVHTLDATPTAVSPVLVRAAADAIKQNTIALQDFYLDDGVGASRLALVVAVSGRDRAHAVAAIILRIDPDAFLHPLIEAPHTRSYSAETELLRHGPDGVQFLNALRFHPGDAMRQQPPDPTGMAIFARAQRGETGLVEGPDYRGVDAIAVIRPVPNSPWTLVTKIDREELHQQLWQQVVMIGSLTLAVLVATGSTLVWMWRAESRHVLYQRASMAAALGVSEARAHRVAGLYATLSQCNEAIVRSSTEAELFPRVCRSTVQHGGMAMAWIGLMRPDDSVLCVAAHGTGADLLKEVGVIDCASAAGPTHTALRGGHAVWTSDCEHAPPLPWEAEGRSLGWSACASLPLCRLGRTVGALTIYAFSADAFDDDGRRLLQELANNISFALDNFDRDARREDAESALREKERFLSESQRIAHVGSWLLGPDGPTFWSDEMFRLFDLPATGHPPTREAFVQRVHPDDHDALFAAIARAWASRAPVEFEHRLVMDDGSIRYLVTRAEARQASAAGDALEGATQDITERRTAELARHETEARYRNLVDHAPVAIFVNRDDKVVLVNDACAQLFGAASPSDLLGRSPLTLFDPAHSEEIRRRIIELRTHGTPQAHQPYRIVRMDGSMLDVETSAAVFDDAGMRAIHVALIDTSDRLRAEELLRGSVREKEALLKEVHHRVKNNLQVITSLLRLESGRSADAGVRTVLGEMQDRILSMALLHETLYRSGSFASIDLARYVTQLAQQIFRSQTPSPAIMLRVQAEPTSIELDQAIPCGLLVNELVSNALKHGFPGRDHGQVLLTLARVGTELHLDVTDNGIGLPADFDTKRAASLGLQLVADLTRQLRGTLHVGPGPGASFRVTFTPRPSPPPDTTNRTSS